MACVLPSVLTQRSFVSIERAATCRTTVRRTATPEGTNSGHVPVAAVSAVTLAPPVVGHVTKGSVETCVTSPVALSMSRLSTVMAGRPDALSDPG